MFYRRKLVLALLQALDGDLEKINLQKLIFLLCCNQKEPIYEFIPYQYGCYSYSLKADLNVMTEKGLLGEDETKYSRKDKKNYINELTENDKKLVQKVVILYGKMDANKLMKHTYTNYPYYAINSRTAERLLTPEELLKVHQSKPTSSQKSLFTIGYEGISLEAYLNKLIKNDVRVLVDVRFNPISQKFGFSKSQLQHYCANLGIEYIHMPDVGIKSELRQELKDQSDYDKLFAIYTEKILSNSIGTQNLIIELVETKHRIALTCFEANICQCHRKHLAESILNLTKGKINLKHI